MTALKAGAAYFAAVFAIGFILGVVRVVVLEPSVGELTAVMVELPIILIASWFACGLIIRKLNVPPTVAASMLMGLIAFALLMTAELTLARYGLNRTLTDQFREWASVAGAAGLAGQIVFAFFPFIQVRARK